MRLSAEHVATLPMPPQAQAFLANTGLARARRIVRFVANRSLVTPAEIFSPSRAVRIAAARHLVGYLVRRLALRPAAAARFMGRDRKTIYHSVGVIERKRDRDPDFARELAAMIAALGDHPEPWAQVA